MSEEWGALSNAPTIIGSAATIITLAIGWYKERSGRLRVELESAQSREALMDERQGRLTDDALEQAGEARTLVEQNGILKGRIEARDERIKSLERESRRLRRQRNMYRSVAYKAAPGETMRRELDQESEAEEDEP